MNPDPLAVIAARSDQLVLVVVAGPNGAGKTTFFEHYLDDLGLPYVNADRVAVALRTVDPAARPAVIDRRAFEEAEAMRALGNLRAAIPLADDALLFDNSSYETPYRLVAAYRAGALVTRHPPLPKWTRGLPGP